MKRIFYYNITYKCNQRCLFCAADLKYDNEQEEMKLIDIIRDFEEKNVGVGDRVIINGGEPTVHKEFLKILEAIRDRGAYIDLFTNGQKLADMSFCQEIIKFSPILIRIPIFGADEMSHDMMTGTKSSFVNLLKAIENILILRKRYDNVDLEIKFLMSKFTNQRNMKIFELLTEKFPDKDYFFSLNPLLVSKSVIDNKDIIFESYSNSIEESKKLIETISNYGWELNINLIPFCLLPSELYKDLLDYIDPNILEYYSDPNSSMEFYGNKNGKDCDICVLRSRCNHFPESYVNFFGDSEIKPIRLVK